MKQVRTDRLESRWIARLAGAGAAIVMTMLAACDGGSDRLAAEVERIQSRIEAMHTATGVPAPAADRAKVYTETISAIKALSGKANESQQAALSVIQAQAQAGLAEIEVQEVGSRIAAVTRAASQVRSALDLYTSQHALADSLLGYSPSEDLASLDEQTALIESRIAETRRLLAENDQALAVLRAAASELEAQAENERDKAARLQVDSLSASTADRASMIEQAKDHLLAAAEFERERAEMQIEIDRAAPIPAGAEDEIVRLQRQLDRLAVARTAVRDMDRELTKQSQAARKLADEAAAEVARRAERLGELVDAELTPAIEGAMSKFNAAAGDVGRARGGSDRSMAQLLGGSIASSTAALAQSRAEVMGNLAALMGELSGVRPPLAGRERYAQMREQYASAASEAASEFRDQSQRAASSFQGSGAGGEAGQVLSSVAEFYTGQLPSEPEPVEDDASMDGGGVEPAADAEPNG